MPKRIPTPPPPEDEPRYLTVVHPYPLNANLELHADRRTLALWLACCTGKDVLLAMFHKPASPGMVVIEVDRDFDNFNGLLGLHTWSEFLQKPNKEQLDKVSKVFYCTYNTGRLVEKNGWKRVNIEEHWFNGWKRENAIIRHPYPKTSHCDLPSEAKTGAPMCRPLPQKAFPVPPPPPAPPVGSPEWLAARNVNPTASPTPSYIKKGRQAAPSDTASVRSASSRGAKSFSPPPSAPSSTPSSVMANYRAKNDVAWKRGPPSAASSVASAAASRAPSTADSANVWSARGAPRGPPSLGPLPPTSQPWTSERFDWSEDVEEQRKNNPPARSPAPSLPSNPARRPPYDPDGPVEPSREYEYNEEDRPRHSKAAAMSDIFEGDPPPPQAPPSVRGGRGGTRPPDLDDPDYDPWNPPADTAPAEPTVDQPETGDPATPWAGYDAPRLEPPTKVKKKGEWTCPQHGPLCNPGICKERARVERDERMRIQREKWEEERIERETRRAKNKKRDEKREKDAEAMGFGGRSRPPHMRRGSASSNADSDTSRDRDSTAPLDQEDWSIPWEAREGTDTQSVVSSARRAWNTGAGSDDEDDYADGNDGLSVARSRTTNTNTNTNTSSGGGSRAGSNNNPTPPASVISNVRGKGPPTRQSAWDARSTASSTPSVPESVWPTESGFSSRAPSVSAAGSDNGRRSGTRPATRSDGRSSSVSSSSTRDGPPMPYTAAPSSAASGFPTFADTHWGDPIAMALADAAKEGKRDRGRQEDGAGEEAPSGSKTSKGARKRQNKAKSALVQAQATHAGVLEEAVLDVQLPPGGPGSKWGDPNDEPW